MPLLTIFTPCYNEEKNVAEVHRQVQEVMATLPGYDYDHLFIDNASTDGTVEILRGLAARDEHVRVIVNTRNFGTVRSPYHAMLVARGDAVVCLVADLQDPPELIPQFVRKWEEGYKIAIGVKAGSQESKGMSSVRRLYYWLIGRLSEIELVSDFTGFGLYDRAVVEQCRDTGEQAAGSSATSVTHGPRSSMCSRHASAAFRSTTSTAFTTSPCSASPVTPKCLSELRP